jgi:hypothetical protein
VRITKLRIIAAAFALATITTATQAHAAANSWGRGGNFGLGIMLGEPSALTARYDKDNVRAIQGGLAFFYSSWTLLYIDGLYKFDGALGKGNAFFAQTTPYVGLGGVFVWSSLRRWESRRERYFSTSDDSNFALGLRVPLGMEWRAATAPIGAFIELAPGLTILPGTFGFMQIGIGARFYF